ncbi:MAG TPA: hypothetical protein VL633_07610 [Bacteroidota bacterium]|nr:hypothetical protein [Bacteroidota bacterium]
MTESTRTVLTIARTEVLFRIRTLGALITILVVAIGVYFIVPDISTGRTLIQVDNGRVFYTSAAVALGTAMFCTLFMSIIGFYVVGNAFRRDIITRTGFVIAATPVSDSRYILGKFLGSACYLSVIMLTCMVSSMVMFLIRGEGSLEPFVFLRIYLWLVLPTIAYCSAIALAFEALPLLSGRFGDVLYFFVWGGLLGVSGASIDNNFGAVWINLLDVVGIVPIIGFMRETFQTTSLSIGSTSFNAAKAPILLNDLPWSLSLIGQRMAALVLPIVFLALARSWFHRFNPTRIKLSARQSRKSILGRINRLFKPATRLIAPLSSGKAASSASIPGAVRADLVATLTLSPFAIVAIIVFACISLLVDTETLRAGLLPAIAIAVVIALADITTRDYASGMMSLLSTAPHLKKDYILWKFASALVIVLAFTAIPIVRLIMSFPNSGISLVIGTLLLAAAAVSGGVLTRSQKPFMAAFLMLLYITLNAKDVAFFDFMGIYGKSPATTQLGYAVVTFLLIALAHRKHASRAAV